MRRNVRRLFSLLLAVALVLGLGLTSVAAIESSLLTLQVTSQHVIRGDEVCVAVNTEADGVVADGKLTFAYDSKSLKFVGAEAGEAWPAGTELSLKVNSGKKDAVVAAFAGAKAAKAGTVLTLKFEALQERRSSCRAATSAARRMQSCSPPLRCSSSARLPALRTSIGTSIITRASTSSSAAVT